ncbi:MAG TPA: aminotransferase class III-fold pyridoxal phosphate-dependent enzyme, partial [Leucothrix sp.]|nr:aminotransferase class III-fold pyridoxal phosphate-dependent enzyme [Leucothrix sp.]
LRALADKHKLLLIVDEIQTGIARTGRLFAYEHYAVEPDIMTLAKGLGGGVPIAALLAKEHCCVFDYGDQGGTFNGNPLMTAVANAIIEEISSIGFLESIKEKSNLLVIGLKKLSKEFGLGEVRGNGLLIALDTKAIDANELVNQALQKGLLINAPRINALRFMPALNVSEEEIEIMLSLLEDVLIGNINDPYC